MHACVYLCVRGVCARTCAFVCVFVDIDCDLLQLFITILIYNMQCCDVFVSRVICCQTNFPTGTIKLYCIVLYCIVLRKKLKRLWP